MHSAFSSRDMAFAWLVAFLVAGWVAATDFPPQTAILYQEPTFRTRDVDGATTAEKMWPSAFALPSFYWKITVGTSDLEVLPDTGSDDLVVPSTLCKKRTVERAAAKWLKKARAAPKFEGFEGKLKLSGSGWEETSSDLAAHRSDKGFGQKHSVCNAGNPDRKFYDHIAPRHAPTCHRRSAPCLGSTASTDSLTISSVLYDNGH
jgi:hypothetical protein